MFVGLLDEFWAVGGCMAGRMEVYGTFEGFFGESTYLD